MRRRCDDIRYDNQLQITHKAKVKVSLRPAFLTMSRTPVDVSTSCLNVCWSEPRVTEQDSSAECFNHGLTQNLS